jgi:uncharacterized membrane protein YdbT with pleckstrin-like domain
MFSFDLHENEKLVKVYHQSESLLIKPVVLVMLALYIPLYLAYQYFLVQKLAWLLGLWILLVLIYAINKYLLWLVTTYLITDQRVVAVTYKTLAQRQTEELQIKDITTVRQKSTGFFSHLFKFGTLELQGGGAPVIFKSIVGPGEAKELIDKLKNK